MSLVPRVNGINCLQRLFAFSVLAFDRRHSSQRIEKFYATVHQHAAEKIYDLLIVQKSYI